MGFDHMTVKSHIVFVEIPEGKAANARQMIAQASKKKSVMNMKKPVYFADQDASIAFTSVDEAHVYAHKKGKFATFAIGKITGK